MRIGRVCRRVSRARADMAESAGHADAIGLDEVGILVIILVGVIFFRVPLVLRRLVKIRVGEQPQADDARRLAEIGADRQLGAVGESRAARADLHAGIVFLLCEWVFRAVLAADVEPKAKTLRIGRRGFVEAGFVDRAHPAPARVAIALFAVAIVLARMRGDDFQQIERREAVLGDLVPEPVIAAGPDQPHVASLDLFGGHGRPIVHVAKIILLGLRETRHSRVWPAAPRPADRRSGLGRGPRRRGGYRQDAHEESNSTRKNVFSHDRFLAQIRRQFRAA